MQRTNRAIPFPLWWMSVSSLGIFFGMCEQIQCQFNCNQYYAIGNRCRSKLCFGAMFFLTLRLLNVIYFSRSIFTYKTLACLFLFNKILVFQVDLF